jgi:hypothetical protein
LCRCPARRRSGSPCPRRGRPTRSPARASPPRPLPLRRRTPCDLREVRSGALAVIHLTNQRSQPHVPFRGSRTSDAGGNTPQAMTTAGGKEPYRHHRTPQARDLAPAPTNKVRGSPRRMRRAGSRQPVLRVWHPLTAQDHRQRRSRRSRRHGDGRKRSPLISDLSRQDHRHL